MQILIDKNCLNHDSYPEKNIYRLGLVETKSKHVHHKSAKAHTSDLLPILSTYYLTCSKCHAKHWCKYWIHNYNLIRVGPLMSGRPWNISKMCPKHRFRCQVLFRRHTWCRVTTTLHIENDDLYKEKNINIIDYLIDYTLPITSDNRLWKISDFPSLSITNSSMKCKNKLGIFQE